MEARAQARYVRVTPMKARRVVDLIRGIPAAQAQSVLRFAPQAVSETVGKVLDSAIANATNNFNLDPEGLVVSAAYVDEGPTMKRIRPRAQGRAYRIRKRSSHITVIVSDGAGQFHVGRHAACWVHAERLVYKLDAFTEERRAAKEQIRPRIWTLYADLKGYAEAPTAVAKVELAARFDAIFTTKTGFALLDRLLKRLHAKKADLLMVLEEPDVALHTNGSENDIRTHVTRRKVSGGTRPDAGRDCRDAFLGLMKTCLKQGVRFWDYLGARLAVPGALAVPSLPELIARPIPP